MVPTDSPAPIRPPLRTRGSNFRPDIEGLRAVAVLAVVLYHLKFSWMPGGFIGVDIFFTISGFLMAEIIAEGLRRGKFNPWQFYQRRFLQNLAGNAPCDAGDIRCRVRFAPAAAAHRTRKGHVTIAAAREQYSVLGAKRILCPCRREQFAIAFVVPCGRATVLCGYAADDAHDLCRTAPRLALAFCRRDDRVIAALYLLYPTHSGCNILSLAVSNLGILAWFFDRPLSC